MSVVPDYGICDENLEVVVDYDDRFRVPMPVHIEDGHWCLHGGIEWFDKNGRLIYSESNVN